MLIRWKQTKWTIFRICNLVEISWTHGYLNLHRGLKSSCNWISTGMQFWLTIDLILNICHNARSGWLMRIKESWNTSPVSSRFHVWERPMILLMSKKRMSWHFFLILNRVFIHLFVFYLTIQDDHLSWHFKQHYMNIFFCSCHRA